MFDRVLNTPLLSPQSTTALSQAKKLLFLSCKILVGFAEKKKAKKNKEKGNFSSLYYFFINACQRLVFERKERCIS